MDSSRTYQECIRGTEKVLNSESGDLASASFGLNDKINANFHCRPCNSSCIKLWHEGGRKVLRSRWLEIGESEMLGLIEHHLLLAV